MKLGKKHGKYKDDPLAGVTVKAQDWECFAFCEEGAERINH